MGERLWTDSTVGCVHWSAWCQCKTEAEVLAEIPTEALVDELRRRKIAVGLNLKIDFVNQTIKPAPGSTWAIGKEAADE